MSHCLVPGCLEGKPWTDTSNSSALPLAGTTDYGSRDLVGLG